MQHYSLLKQLTRRSGRSSPSSAPTTTSSTSSHPTTLNPLLDSAIANLETVLSTVGQADPAVQRELRGLHQRYQERTNPFSTAPSSVITASSEPELTASAFSLRSAKLKCRFCRIRRSRAPSAYPQYALSYTNLALLHQFINLRGMIYPRKLTGNCSRHQRKLSEAVKRARVMGLLSFTSNWALPEGWREDSLDDGKDDWSSSKLAPQDAIGVMAADGTHPAELTALDDLRADEDDDAGDESGGSGTAGDRRQ